MAIENALILTPPMIAVGAVTVPVNVGLAFGANADILDVVAYEFNVVVKLVLVTYEFKVVVKLVLVMYELKLAVVA